MEKLKFENIIINKKSLKGNSMIRKIMVMTALLCVAAFAETESNDTAVDNLKTSRIEKLENSLAKVISKAGIHFGGEFRSQFLYSAVVSDADVGNSVTSLVDSMQRSDEGIEYTSLDLEITARPHSAASGKAIIRIHQDWRNFFGALKSPISARWISMDGIIADMFRYNVGDFRQKYSELFMWSPDIEIDFEPEIFAKYRRMAMNEAFLGDNERILQGINLNLDAEVDPIFKEWHLNIMGARLRSSGIRPEKGGNAIVGEMSAAMFDRYAFGFNTDFTFIPGINLGLTFMDIWDDKNTYTGPMLGKKEELDTLRDRTFITGGRLGLGTDKFLDPKTVNISLNGEMAISIDDKRSIDISSIDTSVSGTDTTYDSTLTIESEINTGVAIRAGIDFSAANGLVKLSADFIRNEEDYINELAQSPTFIERSRIMNVENDLASGDLYSTFDALYRHAFKFSPSKTLGDTKSNGFYKVPVKKGSYTHSVLTKEDMDSLAILNQDTSSNSVFDEINIKREFLNIATPYGPATPNRTGVDVDLDFEFLDKAILIKTDFTFLSTVKNLEDSLQVESNGQTFIEFGGGASIDFGKIGDWWKYPFILSGGYEFSKKSNDFAVVTSTEWKNVEAHFVNAGLYFTFWKRASLLGGFQVLNTNISASTAQVVDFDQMHWAAGLEWKVTENGSLTGSFGQIRLNTLVKENGVGRLKTADHINQVDLYLTVNF